MKVSEFEKCFQLAKLRQNFGKCKSLFFNVIWQIQLLNATDFFAKFEKKLFG